MNNIELIKEVLTELVILTPLTIGVTEVIKRGLGWNKEGNEKSKRFIPMLSVIVGIGFGMLLIEATVTGAVVGLIAGLSASGLWEFGKSTAKIITNK